MKKRIFIIAACLLTACSSKPETLVTYSNSNRDQIIEEVLDSTPVNKDEANQQFDMEDSIDVYYEEKDQKLIFHIANNTDYYYTGAIDFEACESKIAVKALPSGAMVESVVDCPNFEKDSEFMFDGHLYDRKEEKKLSFDFDVYYYEEDDSIFDYALDLDTISDQQLEEMAAFLYTECVLADFEQELDAYIYTKKEYDAADSDDLGFRGYIWINQIDNEAKIFDTEGKVIQEIDFTK